MTNYTTTRLQGEEAEREALRWAGPFGYAVLHVLRLGDNYSDADFLALMERGRREMGQGGGTATFGTVSATYDADGNPAAPAPAPAMADTSHPVAGIVLDPSPGEGYYQRVTPHPGSQPGTPAKPPGRRDASGRVTRPVPR
jgi:hypothetical protein